MMNADTFGPVVNDLVMALVGAWGWMVGARKLGKPPGVSPEYDAWHDRFGGMLRFGGPVVAAGALVVLAFQVLGPR